MSEENTTNQQEEVVNTNTGTEPTLSNNSVFVFLNKEKEEKQKLSTDEGRKKIVDEIIADSVLEEKNRRIGLLKRGLQKLEALKLEKVKIKPASSYIVTSSDKNEDVKPVVTKTYSEADFKKIEELNQKIKKATDNLNLALDRGDYSKLAND